ncbi:tellurite resistance protein [Synergistales bacterium]|nr:tellurite resistance protein [Synergistales bacterium]
MVEIQRGFRCKIDDHFNSASEITVAISVSGRSEYDSCCFGVDSADILSDDSYMVFFNQTASPNREIVLSGSGANTSYSANLSKLPGKIQKLVFTVSIDGDGVMSQISQFRVKLSQGGKSIALNLDGSNFQNEKAIIAIELYKKDVWRLNAVASGFNGGLSELLKHYGGTEAAPPPPNKPASQTKVELRKGQKVNLSKSAVSGEILINLNWTQGMEKKGFFGGTKTQSIDLDLGAFVELTDGTKHVVQALGNSFGSLQSAPYVALDGDDRSGSSSGGENIRVNGRQFSNIRRMLVYTFIYEGAANWSQANGVVTVKYPGGDELAVRLDEYSASQKMCAIAEIANVSGTISVEKLIRFFNSHPDMDKAFGWGFKWVSGSKD